VLTALGVVAARKAEVNQCVEIGISNSKDMAATAAIAPIGAAKLFVLFMPEGDAARPAISSRDINIGFVNELHGVYRSYK
jgi:hypothetical protein